MPDWHPQGEGMPHRRMKSRKFGRTAPFGCAALAILALCGSSAVALAGDDTMSSGTSFLDEMEQIIGVNGGTDVEYSERSPLVVPPTRDLPPPAADAAPAVPDWPKDPDIRRRVQAKAKEKPKPHPDYVIDSSRPLRPDELNVSGGSTSGAANGSHSADYPEQDYQAPKKNIFSFDLFDRNKSEYGTFTGEPTRTSLTDPPPGYLTPSPDQPYGIGPDQRKYAVPKIGSHGDVDSGSAASAGQ
jgi:hypothetical protein